MELECKSHIIKECERLKIKGGINGLSELLNYKYSLNIIFNCKRPLTRFTAKNLLSQLNEIGFNTRFIQPAMARDLMRVNLEYIGYSVEANTGERFKISKE